MTSINESGGPPPSPGPPPHQAPASGGVGGDCSNCAHCKNSNGGHGGDGVSEADVSIELSPVAEGDEKNGILNVSANEGVGTTTKNNLMQQPKGEGGWGAIKR